MTIILTSRLNTHIKDEEENRIPIAIEDTNQIVTNIKKYLKNHSRLVFVANNPENYEENDLRADVLFKSLSMTGIDFEEKIFLDNRNAKNARNILENADCIILSGGKCLRQLKFFKKIGLKRILKRFDGLVIGISAGTMNMCKIVANFPEEEADLHEKRWLKGLGFCDKILMPHFDGENNIYDCWHDENTDVVNDYILPLSSKRELLGLDNFAYVVIDDNGGYEIFGNSYTIKDGKVKKN